MNKSVAIIGGGTMGSGIAELFSNGGYSVALFDVPNIAEDLKMRFLGKENIRIFSMDDIDDGIPSDVEVLIEAIGENMDEKRKLFKNLDEIVRKEVIFVTNTSTYSIDELSKSTKRSDRFAGMHFFNPPSKMKLVEIIKAPGTSVRTIEVVREMCADLKKKSIVLNDSPGFVVNRILFAMLNEAFYLAYNNVAAIPDIDDAMKFGASHPMGPFALADLIGLDVTYSILRSLNGSLKDEKFLPCPLLVEKVHRGELGRKSGKGFYEYD